MTDARSRHCRGRDGGCRGGNRPGGRGRPSHQIYITASSPLEGVRWYTQHMKCQAIADRTDTANCGRVELVFLVQPTQGGTQGTGVNHISFSFPDLPAKMRELEKVGVRGAGVSRLQRFADGALFHDVPGCSSSDSSSIPGGRESSWSKTPRRLSSCPPQRNRSHRNVGVVSEDVRRQAEQAEGAGRWALVRQRLGARSRQEEGKPGPTGGAPSIRSRSSQRISTGGGGPAQAGPHVEPLPAGRPERCERRRCSVVPTTSGSPWSNPASPASTVVTRGQTPLAAAADPAGTVHDTEDTVGRARSAGRLHRQLRPRHSARASQGPGRRQDTHGRTGRCAAGARHARQHLGLRA